MERSGQDEYLFVDSARGFILGQYNLEFNERQIREFLLSTNIPTISLGSRVAFLKKDFVAKFPAYIHQKNKSETEKRQNRVAGGTAYNMRVDAVFAALRSYVDYDVLHLDSLLMYLKKAAPEEFKDWHGQDLYKFFTDKLQRNGEKFNFGEEAEFFKNLKDLSETAKNKKPAENPEDLD